ncbi:MAG TPA: metallophosphoesterase [Candidatus Aminicenantes bacterium]|nr:metallophosphoesterase [Candidatus Aminicenantes bacterium]HRY64122.1 metallophosphoesterase [Candidatus Aminicenantes bacterium]HRZ71035.1 metallophosphoesterase [Candidatus Aminicenantes bacterium]
MIGILSDSHDNLTRVREAVRLFNDAGCDLVIHAGDFVAPFAVEELRNLKAPVKAVYGNCDGERAGLARAFQGIGEIGDAPLAFVHAGLRFVVCHLDSAGALLAARKAGDIVVFGHSHRALVESRDGVLVVNPGETGGWLRGKSTVALLDPAGRTAEIVTL